VYTITLTVRQVGSDLLVVAETSEPGFSSGIRVEEALNLDHANISDEFALTTADLRQYGQHLGKAVFHGEILSVFQRILARADADKLPLHVLLSIEVETLRSVRWERLCALLDGGWRFLRLQQRTPFSIYLPSMTDRRFPPIARVDLRCLVIVANPQGLDKFGLEPFDAEAVIAGVREAMGEIPCDVLAAVDGTAGPPTLAAICERVTAEPYTLMHVVSHTGRRHDDNEPFLLLATTDNQVHPVPASELVERLGVLRGARGLPHLTFLGGCETASRQAKQGLGTLGQRLVRELGIPAVVAITEPVSLPLAQQLASEFYQRLRQHGSVDVALNEACGGIADRGEILIPALFSRLGGRKLFDEFGPLTIGEWENGLQRMESLIGERAPALRQKYEGLASRARAALDIRNRTENCPAIDTETAWALAELQTKLQPDLNELCEDFIEGPFDELARDLRLRVPKYDARCPFPGLGVFDVVSNEKGEVEDFRPFFFGRKQLTEKICGLLREHRFLAVLGGSGTGKSSLVRAGVLEQLRKEKSDLQVIIFPPGRDPLGRLQQERARTHAPDILVVDQFEELFTLCTDANARKAFLAELLPLRERCPVVITMRTDFLGECAEHDELHYLLNSNTKQLELLQPLRGDELREVVEQQRNAVGLQFEPELAKRIFEDLEHEPGAMHLLQHCLRQLWNYRHGRWLRAEGYRAVGGVKGAISETAEAFYRELSAEDQERVRNIFMRLTRLSEDSGESRDTRQRVRLEELIPTGSKPAQTKALLGRLADARLIVTSGNPVSGADEVEVAHEALIRHWARLRNWLANARAELRLLETVREASHEWQLSGRTNDMLVHRGVRLEQVKTLMERLAPRLNALEYEYLRTCIANQDAEHAERERTEHERRIHDHLPRQVPWFRNLFEFLGSHFRFQRYRAGRPLTAREVADGARRLGELLVTRAPRLLDKYKGLIADLLSPLRGGELPLNLQGRPEVKAAFELLDRFCTEVVEAGFRDLARGQEPPVYDARCPFPGLNPFTDKHRMFFFGRENLRTSLIEGLKRNRFVALLGNSGSGKSSLALGFLIPEMQQSDTLLTLEYLTPTADPIVQLAVKVAPPGGQRAVTVIDQFEEVFTLCRDENRRREFIDRVLDLPATRPVVVTMRSDFWRRCAGYPRLLQALKDHGVSVDPMDVGELKETITRQSKVVDLRFQEGLIERILDDVRDEPGRMPLLQHALFELWTRRHGRWLVHEEYQVIGKVLGAIAQTAEESFKILTRGDQGRVRNIFVRLTRLGEDTAPGETRRDTRRRVALEELIPAGDNHEKIVELVTSLANSKLIVTSQNEAMGREEVELAHEALIRQWVMMRQWLDESALPELRLRESVRDAAIDWDFSGRREVLLIHRGDRLSRAERQAQSPESQFNRVEVAYIQACAQLRDRGEKERMLREALEDALVRARQAPSFGSGRLRHSAPGDAGPRVEFHIHVYDAEPSPGDVVDPKTYRAQLTVPTWRKYYPPSRISLDKARLDLQADDPLGYGKSLGEMVFADAALGPSYEDVLRQAQVAGDKLRVSLQLEAPELHAIRWERLHHNVHGRWMPLGSNAKTPFSRYVFSQEGFNGVRPLTDRPVRVLVVIANPAGLDKLELSRIPDDEREALKALFRTLEGIVPTFLESETPCPPTLLGLRSALAEKFHVVHFHAHGALDSRGVALYLQGDEKPVHFATTNEIVDLFTELAEPPRVCFFAACESGAQTSSRARTDGFLPLGPSLVALGGVPAVVAMTERVGMATARLFASQFYRRLLAHGVIDLALNEARASIQDSWDWSVPVLFSGLPDNQIFSFPSNSPESSE
jgi:energy-coupling factor transporter ATP-binding protein EcfA2